VIDPVHAKNSANTRTAAGRFGRPASGFADHRVEWLFSFVITSSKVCSSYRLQICFAAPKWRAFVSCGIRGAQLETIRPVCWDEFLATRTVVGQMETCQAVRQIFKKMLGEHEFPSGHASDQNRDADKFSAETKSFKQSSH
jgi:hypothetical protein